jgi:NAD+ kinase
MVFGIRGNIYKPELPKIACKVIEFLDTKKISYRVEKTLAQLMQKACNYKISNNFRVNDIKLVKVSDFILSIGGDGTFLSTAKLVGDKNVPIIGVNLGKLGFLAELPTEQVTEFITDILNNRYIIEERTVLEASANGSKKIYGLNEIVVSQSGNVKTIEIQAYYNNELVIGYLADGLIVATPTGSTGYSLSAGGPIVVPQSDVIILSPMYPHTLTARPVILPDNGIISVKVISRVPINVVADVNSTIKLKSPAAIEIKKAHYKIKLAKKLDSDYFKILNTKLLWGEDIRNQKR